MAQIQKTIPKQKPFYYKKLRLTDDYQYESEEEEGRQQIRKMPDKNHLGNQQKMIGVNLMNGLIKKKQA